MCSLPWGHQMAAEYKKLKSNCSIEVPCEVCDGDCTWDLMEGVRLVSLPHHLLPHLPPVSREILLNPRGHGACQQPPCDSGLTENWTRMRNGHGEAHTRCLALRPTSIYRMGLWPAWGHADNMQSSGHVPGLRVIVQHPLPAPFTFQNLHLQAST